jgi:hypothetical protein
MFIYNGPDGTASGRKILNEKNYNRNIYYYKKRYEDSIWSLPSPGIRKKPSSAAGLPIKSSAAAGLPLIKPSAALKASSAAAGLPRTSSAAAGIKKQPFYPTLHKMFLPGSHSFSVSPGRRDSQAHGGSRSRRTVRRKHKSYSKSKRVRHTRRKQTRRHRHRR